MALAAIIHFVNDTAYVLFNHHAPTDAALRATVGLQAHWSDEIGCWLVPATNATQLFDLFDELGYFWTINNDYEVTWSDELYGRAPPHIHPRLTLALAFLLHPYNDGDAEMFWEFIRSWRTFR